MQRDYESRFDDILDCIAEIETLAEGRTQKELEAIRVHKAAFERFVEIISEASRHIPAHVKAQEPHIPWRRIADIGNHLRHGYSRLQFEVLWKLVSEGELDALKAAVARLRSPA